MKCVPLLSKEVLMSHFFTQLPTFCTSRNHAVLLAVSHLDFQSRLLFFVLLFISLVGTDLLGLEKQPFLGLKPTIFLPL